MTVQRILWFLLIGLQAAALGYLSKTQVFPAAVTAVALFGVFSKTRFRWNREQKFWLTILLAILSYLKYTVAPHELRLDAVYIGTPLALTVGQFLIVLGAAQFFVYRDDDRLPLWLPGLGAVGLVSVLNVRVGVEERFVAQILTIAFTLVAALYFGSSRKALPHKPRSGRLNRAVANGVVLALVAVIGWFASSSLYHYERRIEKWMANMLPPLVSPPSLLGFSRQSRLDSVSRLRSGSPNRIALRVYADEPPGYLRGQAFDRLNGSTWQAAAGRDVRSPVDRPPYGIPDPHTGQRTFAVDHGRAPQWRMVEVWPDATLESAIFTPLSATHLQAPVRTVEVNDHRIVESGELLAGLPYAAYVPKRNGQPGPPRPIAARLRSQTTTDLTDGDPRVRRLAQEVFAGCQSTAEKIEAVEKHFRSQYQYHLGIRVPDGVESPLVWFLVQKPAAHCEYFAAGTVALLRLANVPCRYVTGFVAAERNRFGGYWVARNKDAHAWAEAYDERRGWVIVESTPAAGCPVPSSKSPARQFWESLQGGMTMFRARLAQGGLKWLGPKLLDLLVSLPGLLIAVGVGGVWMLMRWRKSFSRLHFRQDPVFRQLHRLLRRMDSRLRKHNLQRRPAETLNQFADRIVAECTEDGQFYDAAEWYRLYASVRYGEEIDRRALDRLARQKEKVERKK